MTTYTSTYIATFEPGDEDRVKMLKELVNKKDFDAICDDFNFDDNETVIDAFFDDEDRLHIIYDTEEDDDDNSEGEKFMCTDGQERTQDEYDMWISNLLSLYEMESDDLTEDEIRALVEGGYIDEEDI